MGCLPKEWPSPTSKSCWLFGHKWSEWTDTGNGQLLENDYYLEGKKVVGHYIQQERRCTICNKVKIRTEKTFS